jgi:predicted small metal-binding protein
MKTMTCRQLGGPCDHEHHGESANDVIKAQDRHLRDLARDGDEAHRPAQEDMKDRWRKPVSGLRWYRAAKRDFSALPDS